MALWRKGLAEYGEMEGIGWQWQSMDGALLKAPLAREYVGPHPTDRGETMGGNAVCWWTPVEVPPAPVGSGANAQDVKLLAPTLDRTVISRPEPAAEAKENLCADAGCKGEPALQEVLARNYVPHVKQRREETAEKLRHPRLQGASTGD